MKANRQYLSLSVLSITMSILTSCSNVVSHYEPPEIECVPCEWHSPQAPGMHMTSAENFIWWESLNDPLLNSLIQQASQQNLDLSIAALRILEARQEQKAKNAYLYPHIDGSVTAGNLYFSKDAMLNGVLKDVKHKKNSNRNINFFEMGFDAEWEIDLFGATAHEINALKAQLEASEDNLNDVWVILSAEIAKNYIQLRGFQQRLAILERNIESQKDTIHLTEELLTIGQAGALDLNQAQDQLTKFSAQKPLLQLAGDKAIHRLSILLGYAPSELFCELTNLQPLPLLPCHTPIGVPSELLRRRPDIRRAERNLAAATERIDVAIAALFPRLSLRGFVGQISTHLSSLLNPSSTAWLAAPQLLLPIFNSRLIQQDIEYSKIKTQQALYDYQKTVLEALEETENAIASFHYELERNHALVASQQLNQEACALAQQLYQRGVKSYPEVLVTNRSLFDAQDSYLQSQVDLLLHYIALYKALGGAWETTRVCCESFERDREENN
jgi:outer membrane protein, multidrug efflux system